MKIPLLAAAALLAVAPLSACGDEDPAGASDESAALSLDDLDGRDFVSVRVDGHRLVRDTELRIGFAGDDLQAYVGCNHLFGIVALDAGALTVSDMGGTEIGCPDDLGRQDQWLIDFLTGGPEIELTDDTLTLTSGKVVIELTELDVPDAEDDPEAPTGDSDEGVVENNG